MALIKWMYDEVHVIWMFTEGRHSDWIVQEVHLGIRRETELAEDSVDGDVGGWQVPLFLRSSHIPRGVGVEMY